VRGFHEYEVESTAIQWFAVQGYNTVLGPDIAPGEPAAERESYGEVVLPSRLRRALVGLNPDLPTDAISDAFRKLTIVDGPFLAIRNRDFHRLISEGVPVEFRRPEGGIGGGLARVIDYGDPDNNDWLVVNQFTVIENQINRRSDVVVFVNGIPLAVIELKNPADEKADIWTAFYQLETYKHQIPSLFVHNAIEVISDGTVARMASITADKARFMPWRTIDGDAPAPPLMPEMEVLIRGAFDKARFLDYVRHFIAFEESRHGGILKKIAGYHQYHAVNRAIETTVAAARPDGDRRAGVVWHTQGSGKSLTMLYFAGKIILHPAMENPTIVMLTDRNDLDGQLFGTFSKCKSLLRQDPVQAESRAHLRRLLRVASGGVVFTTIQKFFPEEFGDRHPKLSDRRNIVVIADEAHRSQYDFIDGFARHMHDALPNASFIGFTGTPIELTDKNTRAVFGDYIDVYDIQRAVRDGATVPIYYESRLAKLELSEAERPRIDPDFEEATEGEDTFRKESLKSKWAALEAVVGAEKRLRLIVADLVRHFEARLVAMDGKAMIVCMSRRICVDVYNEIIGLHPEWHDEDDTKGAVKIIMTGSATDPVPWLQHTRNKDRRDKLADRFRNPADPFKIAIVRDMWLTGFDVPCLHTMYIDKPMRGHALMQAIARVNRVFGDKPGGLIVDYIGLADQLQRALKDYTDGGGQGETAIDQEKAVAILKEKHEVCCQMFHGFDWSAWATGTAEARIRLLPGAQNHILGLENGKSRFVQVVTELSHAFALSVPHEAALGIQDDVGFFQTVRAGLLKGERTERKTDRELDFAIRQIISRAVMSDEVVDLYAYAGLRKPDISILSDEFLAEVRALPHRNLAVEVLRKLLAGEIKTRSQKNVVQARSFAEMLEKTVRSYQNRAIQTIEVIEELILLARQMREADARGENLNLSTEEVAFYDALGVNDSAVKVLGDETLMIIARELVRTVRENVSIDWTIKESVRAKLRVMVKRILRKYGYPPDKEAAATQTVLEQAEVLCGDWAQ